MYRILFVENNDAIRAGLMTALDYDALGCQPMAASGFPGLSSRRSSWWTPIWTETAGRN